MADNPFQISGKDYNGNISVVGGNDYQEYKQNLIDLYEGDEAAVKAVLSQSRATLLPSETVAETPAKSYSSSSSQSEKPLPPGSSASGKVYLDVPFDDKDEAKTLGARWDGDAKKWAFNPRFVAPSAQQELLRRFPNR